jgi:hypothetical protein
MSAEPPMLTTTHLVSHCLREIESAMRDVLEPVVEDQSNPGEGERNSQSGISTHELEIRAIVRGLGILETDPVAEAWLRLPGKDSTYNLAGRAHRNSLDRPRSLDLEFRRLWDDMQYVLDTVLDRFETRYSHSHKLLDELLEKSIPTRKDLQRLKEHAPNNSVSYRYFFDRLESEGWLQSLRDEGFFRSPPEPEQDYEQGGFRFVPWPQTSYLEKMADVEPATVKDIIKELPPTENIPVHQELAEVTLKLPAHMVAELVPKLREWARHPVQWILPEKLSDLVERLAQGGQIDPALALARELFALSAHNVFDGSDGATLPPSYNAKARFEDFLYTECLDKCSVILVEEAGERALMLLCDLLEDALYISVGSLEGRAAGSHRYEDLLHVWRPAIENHSQNHPRGLEGYLISVVRDAAERLAETNPERVPELVRLLEERKWRTFERLALHLLWRFPDAAPELISECLTDRRHFEDSGLRHEYALLAQSNFVRLDAENQAIILGWIEEGPDMEDWKDWREEATGQRPKEEGAARAAGVWKRDQLALLGSDLPAEWKERYEELVEEVGPPDHPEFASYTRPMWVGPESPMKFDDLKAMTAENIVVYLKSWHPSSEFMSPSPEGLARELSSVIAEDPERFAVASNRFRKLDPTYVHGLIDGLSDAAKQGHAFSWSPVLDLCLWVVRQPREIIGREEDYRELIEEHDLDPDWGWTRKAIGDLLEEGFKANVASIPPELRDRAWEVLRPLTDDPEPDAEYEERYGGSNMDPATLSLNTVRGQAMHAVVRYALWVRGHLEGIAGGDVRLVRGFKEMPEVRSVLDEHLDPEKDSSLAVRAVYGQWFPQLALLDESWAVKNVPDIFPSQEPLRELRRAAWETYVIFQVPYDGVFEILHEEYEHAIHQLSSDPSEEWWLGHPEERLVEHLMARYWQGKLNPEDTGDLLAQFYDAAPDELRAHAVEFLTRHLHIPEVEVSEEILRRLKTLGEVRLSNIPEVAPDDRARELGAFAGLFASGRFDKQWALEQLSKIVFLGGKVDLDQDITEYLASCAPDMPLLSVRCLEGLIEGNRDDWRIFVRKETIRELLVSAIQGSNRDAQREAKEVANRLVARGYSDYYDLAR